MRAVDTNILARFILRDDERQTREADAVLGRPVWIADTVLLELGWVLGRRLGMDRTVMCAALATVLDMDTVHIRNRVQLLWAIDRFAGGADWADMMHLVVAGGAADTFVTFDPELSTAAGPTTPIAIETLA